MCSYRSGCHFDRLSCRYLKYLNKSVEKIYYDELDDALSAVRKGYSWGAIFVSNNFSDAFIARIALGKKINRYKNK